MVSDGNLEPHLFPSGANEDGPVLPWQPPITFGQTTKYLSVSVTWSTQKLLLATHLELKSIY